MQSAKSGSRPTRNDGALPSRNYLGDSARGFVLALLWLPMSVLKLASITLVFGSLIMLVNHADMHASMSGALALLVASVACSIGLRAFHKWLRA